MDKKGNGIFWIVIVIVIILVIIAQCSGGSSRKTNKEEALDAITLVQESGRKQTTLDSLNSEVDSGDQIIGWSAYKYRGDTYDVYFTVRDNDKEIVYEWRADLDTDKIEAKNHNAKKIIK